MGPRHPADNAIYYGNTGINNLRAQLGGCIELSSHKTSVKCGHINTDTDQTTSGGMLNVDSNFGFSGMLSASGGMLIASLGMLQC